MAIGFVLIWHVSLRIIRHTTNLIQSGHPATPLDRYVPHGEIGVALFFVISGFVLYNPLLRRDKALNLKSFYLRRFWRIYPPYAITLALCVAPHLIGIWHDRNVHNLPFYPSLLANVFYLNGIVYDHPSRFNPPFWSLEVEIQFYLLFPFLALALRRMTTTPTNRILSLCAAAIVLLASAALTHAYIPYDSRFRFGLLAHIHLFILGMIIAELVALRGEAGRVTRWNPQWWDLMFVIGTCLLIAMGLVFNAFDEIVPGGGYFLIVHGSVVVALALMFAGAFEGRWVPHLLRRPAVLMIGAACYSIYLIHVPVIEACGKLLAHIGFINTPLLWFVWWAITLAVLAPSCALFYFVCERPFRLMSHPAKTLRTPEV